MQESKIINEPSEFTWNDKRTNKGIKTNYKITDWMKEWIKELKRIKRINKWLKEWIKKWKIKKRIRECQN